MREYKHVMVGSGALKTALDNKNEAEAAKVFKETTNRFNSLYSEEDRHWFFGWRQTYYPQQPESIL